mgnify:CR=1 FL=1
MISIRPGATVVVGEPEWALPAKDAGAVALAYGVLINAVVNFLIVAFALSSVICLVVLADQVRLEMLNDALHGEFAPR